MGGIGLLYGIMFLHDVKGQDETNDTTIAPSTDCQTLRNIMFPDVPPCPTEMTCSDGYMCSVTDLNCEYTCLEMCDSSCDSLIIDGVTVCNCASDPHPFTYDCSMDSGSLQFNVVVPKITSVSLFQ